MKTIFRKWGSISCILFCLISFWGCNSAAPLQEPESETPVKKEFYIENGYYTVGIDIPSGICDINATAGTGNIFYSADGTIDTYNEPENDLNQIISVEDINGNDIIDYTLSEGYVLHISGAVRVQLKYSTIDGEITGRQYDEENKIILKPGSYEVGKDFNAGMYLITAIDGNGTITSSNAFTLGIDELFGVFDGTEAYVPKAVNITLAEGDILDTKNVTVEMQMAK